MKRAGRLAVVIWLACGLAIGISAAAARKSGSSLPDWLSDNSCVLPCWNGITPGLTSFGQAMTVLSSLPEVAKSTITGRSEDRATWLWFMLYAGNRRIYVELDGETSALVQDIWFYPAFDRAGPTIRLADLNAAFGPPQHVSADSQSNALLHLMYRTPNIEAILYLPGAGTGKGALPASGCDRLQVSSGLYLGPPLVRAYEDQWHGFTAQFDRICARPH